ncbi:hypothetical protein NDU88_000402 [Pleurodeles waltl]|uniref:Uncharacterized protein n=1 Tax=Pleurodeles waltl TaxID=8319 RepID=A0AAV7U524_PLEWA|nr:hypothetical protein NDU88_000402 [Pleurodeles waltl]
MSRPAPLLTVPCLLGVCAGKRVQLLHGAGTPVSPYDISPSLFRLLIERSYGIPYYCEELLKSMYINKIIIMEPLEEEDEDDEEILVTKRMSISASLAWRRRSDRRGSCLLSVNASRFLLFLVESLSQVAADKPTQGDVAGSRPPRGGHRVHLHPERGRQAAEHAASVHSEG